MGYLRKSSFPLLQEQQRTFPRNNIYIIQTRNILNIHQHPSHYNTDQRITG